MWYFFDESGNWQGEEYKRLVIGGIVVENEDDVTAINKRIGKVHANEMEMEKREKILKIILELLQENRFKALLYVIDPTVLFKTQKEEDEIYADIASDLMVEIVFGDSEIEVEYDMKFYYSYPVQILENIKNNVGSREFKSMKKNFFLKANSIERHIDRIKKLISKYRLNMPEMNKKFISDYLWEEFRLKIEKNTVTREKFKDKVNTKLKEKYKLFNIDSDTDLFIKYEGKHTQSGGVGVIDFLTNIVRHHGKNPSSFSSPVIEEIYKFITIKEKNG